MGQRFGTDGIRGRPPTSPLDPETTRRLGAVLGARFPGGIALVRDTRESGLSLRDSLFAGLGAKALDLGVLPTPALSALLEEGIAGAGVAITASHNPWRDNGLKVLGPGGRKLLREEELAIEAALDRDWPSGVGLPRQLRDAAARYQALVLGKLPPGRWLAGKSVVLDAAHGAGWQTAPAVLRHLGAEVDLVGGAPTGRNINQDVGAVHPEALARRVVEGGASVGIGLDGDADRCVLVDASGRVVDGDAILLLLARGPGVVGTVMSNGALEVALEMRGLGFCRAAVGDRSVSEEMRRRGWPVGGEPSGHILLEDAFPTGDGLLAALRVLAGGLDLVTRLQDWKPFPQVNLARAVSTKPPLEELPAVARALDHVRDAGASQWVLRYSGTEPVIRVMVEAPREELARQLADGLAAEVLDAIAGAS